MSLLDNGNRVKHSASSSEDFSATSSELDPCWRSNNPITTPSSTLSKVIIAPTNNTLEG